MNANTLADIEALSAENAALRTEIARLQSENSILRIRSKLVVPPEFTKVLSSLLHSRKVLVALVALVQTIALHSYGVDPIVWGAIDGVLIVLINSISTEDAAEKGAAQTTIFNSPTVTTEEPG